MNNPSSQHAHVLHGLLAGLAFAVLVGWREGILPLLLLLVLYCGGRSVLGEGGR